MIQLKKILGEGKDEIIEKFISLLPKYNLEFHGADNTNPNCLEWRNSYYPTITDKEHTVKVGLDRTDIFPRNGNVWLGDPSHPLLNGYVIQAIVTNPSHRQQGKAREILKNILAAADDAGLLLKLEPIPMKDFIKKGEKGLTRPQLTKWYSKYGFEKHPEANIMTRLPKINESEKSKKEAVKMEEAGRISFLIVNRLEDENLAVISILLDNNTIGRINMEFPAPYKELASAPPTSGYLFVDSIFIRDPFQQKGYGYRLYKEALKFAAKHKFKGLISSRLLRSDKGNTIWKMLKTFSDDYFDYVDIADLGNRLKEEKLIGEAKNLDLSKLENAAEYLIRRAWAIMPRSVGDVKYLESEVFLYIDNEEPLLRMKEELIQKFFPNDENGYEKLDFEISKKLEELESQKTKKLSKKISTDPLFILKQICRGKKWDAAKKELYKNSVGGWSPDNNYEISDENANVAFERLYRNAMGETSYSKEHFEKRPLLSTLRRTKIPQDAGPHDYVDEKIYNNFLNHYAGYNAEKFNNQVKVYRGVNNPTVKIRPGDYVTFDKGYAYSYRRGKFGTILSDILPTDDLYLDKADVGMSELIYWPKGHTIKKYEGKIPTFKEFWHKVNYEGF